MILALRKDHETVGGIGGLFANDPNDGLLVAQEAFWFIHPETRSLRSLRLIEAFETCCQERGAKRILLAHLVGDEKIGRFFHRIGYKPLETFYGKGI